MKKNILHRSLLSSGGSGGEDSTDYKDYLSIIALEDDLTVTVSYPDIYKEPWQYSIDSGEWIEINSGESTTTIKTGQIISFKALLNVARDAYRTLSIDKMCSITGNSLSMVYGGKAKGKTSVKYEYALMGLFAGNTTIMSVDSDFLPATKLNTGCYANMFFGCSNLASKINFPSSEIPFAAYFQMFAGTKTWVDLSNVDFTKTNYYGTSGGLTQYIVDLRYMFAYTEVTDEALSEMLPHDESGRYYLPFAGYELGDKKVYTYYCEGMFRECKNLKTAPNISESIVGGDYMFCNSSIEIGPDRLPVAAGQTPSAKYMFYGCTKLKVSPEIPKVNQIWDSFTYMFYGCTSLETPPPILESESIILGTECMFYGCSNLKTSPKIKAKTLKGSACYNMFYNCTSLEYAPILEIDNVESGIYEGTFEQMFYNCVNLKTQLDLTGIIPSRRFLYKTYYNTPIIPDCSIIDFSSQEIVSSGALRGIFSGTLITDEDLDRILPHDSDGNYCLPCTNVGEYSYAHMFEHCPNITKAPKIYAEWMDNYACYYMFNGCRNLIEPADVNTPILNDYSCGHMYYGTNFSENIKIMACKATNMSISPNFPNTNRGKVIISPLAPDVLKSQIYSGREIINPTECTELTISAEDVLGNITKTTIRGKGKFKGVYSDGEELSDIEFPILLDSEEFPMNTSTTESINREISFTVLDKTATCTITHKPLIKQSIICKYYIDSTSKYYPLFSTSSSVKANFLDYCESMIVDGVEVDPVQKYAFSSTGEHTVEFKFIDTPANIYYWFYVNNLIHIDLSKYIVTSISNYSLYTYTSSSGGYDFNYSVILPETVTSLSGRNAISSKLNKITFMGKKAPTITDDFVNSFGDLSDSNIKGKVRVPVGATGYDTALWQKLYNKGYIKEEF